MKPLSRLTLAVLAALLLAWVFSAYLEPEFMRDVADTLWSCF